MRKDEPFVHIREVVRLTVVDVAVLLVCVGCFALMLVATRIGYEPAGFAFGGAVAFSLWVLNIVNRVIGTLRLMYERLVELQRQLEDLVERLDREKERKRVLPKELQE